MGERIGQIAKVPEVKQSNSNSRVRRTERLQSMDTPVDRILFLQRTVGNQAVSRLMKSGALQTKLRIGQPGDVYEQEADRVAYEVMRMPEPGVQRQAEEEEEETLQSKPLANQITSLVQIQRQEEPEEEEEMLQTKPLVDQITPLVQVQRQEEPEEEEEMLQAKPLAEEITPLVQRQVEPEEEEEEMLQAKSREDATSEVPNDLESQINAIRGGQPLAESERTYFEPRFGADFSQVRVHTDTQAAESARAVNARAFTVGNDVVFASGQYAPGASEGRRLLAHELTHVVQQGKGNSIKREKAKSGNTFDPITRFNKAVDLTIQRSCSTAQINDCSDEDLLTAICIGEAGNISNRDGKKGVINVVMNRMVDSAFPISIRDVVTATGQFNGLNQGIRNLNNPGFSDCRDIAREVFNNPTDDPTLGALWFNQSCVKPCSQYCTTYLGDESSPAHYFSRRATSEEQRICERSRRRVERHCCDYPRTRISYVTFTEEEVEPIIGQSEAEEVIQPKLL